MVDVAIAMACSVHVLAVLVRSHAAVNFSGALHSACIDTIALMHSLCMLWAVCTWHHVQQTPAVAISTPVAVAPLQHQPSPGLPRASRFRAAPAHGALFGNGSAAPLAAVTAAASTELESR